MKKLLSLLTISTLTASVPAPLLANTTLTRAKHDVSTLTSNSNNDYVPIKEINGINDSISSVYVDSKDNVYFGKYGGAFVLKQGATTLTEINGISGYVYSLAVDSKDNIYFGSAGGAFVLKNGETTPSQINDIVGVVKAIAVDSKDNIYFGTNTGAFVLKQGATTPTKIDGISDFISDIKFNKDNNVYFATTNGIYKLAVGSDTPTKIDGIKDNIFSLAVDSTNNVYFATSDGAFVLKQGATTPTKIDGISYFFKSLAIDKNNNIYFIIDTGAYKLQSALSWVKTQSQFTLVDSSKTKTWTRPDLIAVDGELNIDIANTNIDKVVFDNVQQPQTSKQWKINVKPETAPRDHNLQVMFTLDGKQYTSEITVSMQAKVDPPTPPVQQNLSDLIKNKDLGNIIDNNDDTIFTAVNQKNGNIIDDFSQIEITKKDNNKATLSAKRGSKSYSGAVDITYNVVPATVVDLKIDVKPSAPDTIVVKDYLGQIDTSNITNPVNTFYYAKVKVLSQWLNQQQVVW